VTAAFEVYDINSLYFREICCFATKISIMTTIQTYRPIAAIHSGVRRKEGEDN
jgi:hypothetical protein